MNELDEKRLERVIKAFKAIDFDAPYDWDEADRRARLQRTRLQATRLDLPVAPVLQFPMEQLRGDRYRPSDNDKSVEDDND